MSTTATPSSFSSGSSTASAVAMAFDVTPSIFMPSRLSAMSSRCIGVRRQRMKLNVVGRLYVPHAVEQRVDVLLVDAVLGIVDEDMIRMARTAHEIARNTG